jgi:hypothetical protein
MTSTVSCRERRRLSSNSRFEGEDMDLIRWQGDDE